LRDYHKIFLSFQSINDTLFSQFRPHVLDPCGAWPGSVPSMQWEIVFVTAIILWLVFNFSLYATMLTVSVMYTLCDNLIGIGFGEAFNCDYCVPLPPRALSNALIHLHHPPPVHPSVSPFRSMQKWCILAMWLL